MLVDFFFPAVIHLAAVLAVPRKKRLGCCYSQQMTDSFTLWLIKKLIKLDCSVDGFATVKRQKQVMPCHLNML